MYVGIMFFIFVASVWKKGINGYDMRNKLEQIILYLKNTNVIVFILIGFVAMFVIARFMMAVLPPFAGAHPNMNPDGSEKISRDVYPFIAILISPIIETLIFQSLPHRLYRKYYPNKYWIYLFVSALFFGVVHRYSVYYMFATYVTGVFLLFYYDIASQRKENAVVVISIIHALINALAVLSVYYL